MTDTRVPIQLATRRVSLVERLGSGASAEVWSVVPFDTDDKSQNGAAKPPWALKIGRPETSRYLASEAECLTRALSPKLPRALEVGRLGTSEVPNGFANAPFILMTRVPGVTLERLLESLHDGVQHTRRIHLARCIARDVGCALAELHASGFGHGDLKPENIIVDARTSETGSTEFSCAVIDLGLSTARGSEITTGGTLRYLPPEVTRSELGTSDAQSRDLWALGLVLREVVGAKSASELDYLIESLLAPTPAARPRARWVALQAGYSPDAEAHALAIRRTYLQAQSAFLEHVKSEGHARFAVGGDAKAWLEDACAVLTGLRAFSSATSSALEAPVAHDLTSEQRARFLIQLCGNAAVDFPALPTINDEELVRRLLLAAQYTAPEAFTYDVLVDAPKSPGSEAPTAFDSASGSSMADADLLSLSLELGADNPPLSLLARCEALTLTTTVPLAFVLRLSNAFKRRGELGQARALLLNQTHERARVALAGVLARAGANQECLDIALPLCSLTTSVCADAAAVCARVYLAQGNIERATAVLDAQHDRSLDTPAFLEARASLALALQRPAQAQSYLELALGRPHDAEQHARLEALVAHRNHQGGDHQKALRAYERAVTAAARAGAVMEEATYLVGVASNALPLGRVGDTLQSAQRALLLFEFLHNPSAAARAALNRSSALFVAGAAVEATSAITDTIVRARKAKDARCEALAHLLASDVSEAQEALEHVRRAEQLLNPVQPHDRLRVAARRLSIEPRDVDIVAMDAVAGEGVDPENELMWWAARARHALRQSLSDVNVSSPILSALSRLANQTEPVDVVARAFAAGAELAARHGEGDRSLRFMAVARTAHQRLIEGTPDDLQLNVKQQPWAAWLAQQSIGSPLRSEQVGEIERLVRELSDRTSLRRVLDRVLDALVRWTGVERGLLLLTAPDDRLVVRAARNLAARDLSPEQRQLSQSLAKQALETGDCVVAMDASGELSSLHKSVHALRLRSVLAVPLTARGETQGVVYLDDRVRRGAFGAPELAWVRLVSSIAAVAIAEARDQARLRRAARRAQRAEKQLAEHLSRKESELVHTKLALDSISLPGDTHGMVGRTRAMQAMFGLIARVAPAGVPVFIFGESGTGKELVARALHQQSLRSTGPFVSENCSAIPANLLESILFGHKKGAFTGATHNHIGLFELAHAGTLFLDELGEMSLAMQAKLLRVLETGELRRVGGERSIHVDVRVVGASNRNLELMVQQGTFREDLYYRLNVMTIALPPLRERAADVPELVAHFMRKYGRSGGLNISPRALAALQSYAWPGNVRQLENEIRRAMVLTDDSIDLEHLSPSVIGTPASQLPAGVSLSLRQQLDALEVLLIERALRDAQGNQSRAAETLGVSRFGLQKMLKRLGLSAPK